MYNVGLAEPSRVGEHGTVSPSTATPLERPEGANAIILGALTANAFFSLDGTTPTSTDGFVIEATKPPIWIPVGENMTVTVVSATGKVVYQWYKA